MNDLTETSLLDLLVAIRNPGMSTTPTLLVVSQEGIDRMKSLCDDDPEFRKRVLAEFPQMAGLL